ncbi:lipopolysaccharide biosynthesis protein [Mariniflexile ostreae]|uniref:Lipopolysaccharide biosynthesis protein n=1 Tax=Mariniflexile ostreae TaxID=1520892 RepID=A0ABV5FCR6_9FLAO
MKSSNEQKQVFWFTLINYLGILIGIGSTIFIYPNDKEFLGMVRYVDAIAQLMFPILLFGAGQSLIYFYPLVNEENQKKLFKYAIKSILVISVSLALLLILGNYIVVLENYHFVFYAFPLALIIALIELFKRQAINLQKLSVPTLLEKIIPKISFPIIFLMFLAGYLNVIDGLKLFIASYFIIIVLLALYVFKYYKVNSDFNFKSLFTQIDKKEYYRYSFYAFLGSFGSFLAFRLDVLMIPEFLSFEANGTYSIGVALVSVIGIPALGLFSIYAPMISEHLKNNAINELGKKYIETAKLLFFVGAILYGAIVLGIDSLFMLLPTYDKLVETIPVIMILGANVLFNMGTGFSSEIISYSKYYRVNIMLLFVLVFLNIFLNLYVLTQTDYGIEGVAWASLIAMVLFNTIKLYFIQKKFKILPFDKGYLKLFWIVFVVGLGLYFLPKTQNSLIDLILKSGLFCVLNVFIVYKFKLIYSLNYWIEKVLRMK